MYDENLRQMANEVPGVAMEDQQLRCAEVVAEDEVEH